MGAKISLDSATLMNKGLEVIEAYWLFNLNLAQIEVIIHPESIIHSMVCYQDGSIMAQLGSPDMRTPIAYALSWPERMKLNYHSVDFIQLGQLQFEAVDHRRFPCLNMAYAAVNAGGTASTYLNAANEIAVAAFLQNAIHFHQIPIIIDQVLQNARLVPATTLDAILESDKIGRTMAESVIKNLTSTSAIN
jgi:1-deoxy-D-xylulose-5-phosphate reductoisomerase